MLSGVILVMSLTGALLPASASAQTGLSDIEYISQFKCPYVYPTDKERGLAIKHYLDWVMARHGDWTLAKGLEFRLALLRLHDCEQTISNLKSHGAIPSWDGSFVESQMLPVTEFTSDCHMPSPTPFYQARTEQIQTLRNRAKANKYALHKLEAKAHKKDRIAQFYLATLYDPSLYPDVNTVVKSWKKANFWYRKAAEGHLASAEFSLGNAYAKGDGFKADFKKAVHWYRLAAEHGYVNAAWDMGIAYEKGSGTERNMEKAVLWYCTDAMEGDPEAQWVLAAVYYLGEGVPRNEEKSIYWLTILAREGNSGAKILVDIFHNDRII